MTWGEIKKKINAEIEDDAKIRMLKITNKCDDIVFLYCWKTRDYIISGDKNENNIFSQNQ